MSRSAEWYQWRAEIARRFPHLSAPPEGRSRWMMRLLADRLVELEVVDTIGPECVRTTLKKTNSSRGCGSNG